jgi:hypothetical protein
MRLTELSPQFLKRTSDTSFHHVDTLAEADGILFVCPKCFKENGFQRSGVHCVICWQPSVPQTTGPAPGRWNFLGSSFDDLTLQAGSSSILLLPPSCGWHGFITNGEVTGA